MNLIPEHNKIILFDGVCNLCNSSVQYVIKKDKKDLFLFAPLQSDFAKELMVFYNIDAIKIDSILLYEPKKGISMKSTAILKISKSLGFPTNLLTLFFIIPPFIRNWVYDFIARNRYKWYGRKTSCMVPTPELQAKFLH
ncbi:MAG: DUF393 domain-containing protein [Flavobacteriaceae bacterium]|nr:DUF393 domain-containing protein [Flavobacteriaceae bacterium]